MNQMHIGMNLLYLVPSEVGGSEPYLMNLTSALTELDGVKVTVFSGAGVGAAYPELAGRCEIVELPWASGRQSRRIAAENSWLAVAARKRNVDVIHHGVGTAPFIRNRPSTITIHDIQYSHYPSNFSPIKRAWLQLNVPYSVKALESVCAVSNWVADDVTTRLNADPSKVFVVPFGSENLFGANPTDADTVRTKYGISGPYFYYGARTYKHKNHEGLIRAFGPLAEDASLVLTGAAWPRDAEITRLIDSLGLSGSVRHLGKVPRADLAGLCEGAVALAYPSYFEGFGAPLLEAMVSGCPVVCSTSTCLPEVASDAAILLDAGDLGAWTGTMEKLLSDTSLREDLISRGFRRAAEFTWRKSAELQRQAYAHALTT